MQEARDSLKRLCADQLAYRWFCGGVEINRQTLREFRVMHGDAVDAPLAPSLAALVEEGAVSLQLVSQDDLKARAV
jgi:hypothetical protein